MFVHSVILVFCAQTSGSRSRGVGLSPLLSRARPEANSRAAVCKSWLRSRTFQKMQRGLNEAVHATITVYSGSFAGEPAYLRRQTILAVVFPRRMGPFLVVNYEQLQCWVAKRRKRRNGWQICGNNAAVSGCMRLKCYNATSKLLFCSNRFGVHAVSNYPASLNCK